MRNIFWVGIVIGLVFSNWVDGLATYDQYHYMNETELSLLEANEASSPSLVGRGPLMVGLTLIQNAWTKRAGTIQLLPITSFEFISISF